jgi:hypothetical protein
VRFCFCSQRINKLVVAAVRLDWAFGKRFVLLCKEVNIQGLFSVPSSG